MPSPERAGALTAGTAMVRFRDVHKSFGSVEVLKGVTLDIGRGEVVCIIGPSGSGKSTLLRCVNALEEPTAGLVEVDGEPIGVALEGVRRHELPPSILARQRRHIGMVFQSFNLFPNRTALQNVMEGMTVVAGLPMEEARARAERLLDEVGLAERADSYPSQLSGGQQQRVAIARAMAMEPKVLLFDEPTSALDPELVGEVLAVMRRLAQTGMTMIVVTHEISFAREVASRLVFLDDGRVLECGPPADLLAAPAHPRTREFLARVQ
ncbi:amino acid ABC transporter ATP-binding protein [Streptomyces sp.]|uniref:amino acid ABC transporter ATP-binding protein n=1 Tax=Streptomyces sp. TaxID=1931 RepID=UPI002D789E87|nr:amino acid ABC transporter ATP-binding protein [Streptomyces sp.]HET6354569.1 amino acid ABC transporter ATP-binding protein [Streptomyces sp.]